MITEEEAVARLLAEDKKFQKLLKELSTDEDKAEADYLYQEGVRVADIRKTLKGEA